MENAKQNTILTILLIIVVAFSSVFFAGSACVAYAEDVVEYSDVLDDLHKDSKFDESNYPENFKDYSISLIQIAEGVDDDIFVYVYQPSGAVKDYHASSINVSTSINNALAPFNYKLEYINSSGVFYKYKIKDLKVSDNNIRYYTIPSIYRPFDEQVDVKAGGDNTINEVAFAVSRQYAFGTVNGEPYAECVEIQTIEITDKFVGFVRYKNGMTWMSLTNIDSHFVAFTTDKPMDKLLEARVYFTTQKCQHTDYPVISDKYDFYDINEDYVELNYTQSYTNDDDHGWFAKRYEWDRIQKVDEFLADVESRNIYSGAILDVAIAQPITDDARSQLKTKQWVLRFTETSYSYMHPAMGTEVYTFTQVGNVTILRLKFEYDGEVYNLGVVDNKQTGSSEPINPDWDKPFGGDVTVTLTPQAKETMSTILIVLICVVAVMLLIPIIKTIWSHKSNPHLSQSTPKRSSSSTRKSNNKKPNKKTSKKR